MENSLVKEEKELNRKKKQRNEKCTRSFLILLLIFFKVEEGRSLIMDRTRGLFIKLLPLIEHPNKIRRTGILGVIRLFFAFFFFLL